MGVVVFFFVNEWNCILSLFESRQKKLWRTNLIRLLDNPKKVNFDIYQLVLQRLSSFTIFHPSSLLPLTEESIPYRLFFQGNHSQIMSRSLPGSDIAGRSRNRKSSEVYAYVGLWSFSIKHARATSEGELATILKYLTLNTFRKNGSINRMNSFTLYWLLLQPRCQGFSQTLREKPWERGCPCSAEVKVKSAYEPSGSPGRSLSRFL